MLNDLLVIQHSSFIVEHIYLVSPSISWHHPVLHFYFLFILSFFAIRFDFLSSLLFTKTFD